MMQGNAVKPLHKQSAVEGGRHRCKEEEAVEGGQMKAEWGEAGVGGSSIKGEQGMALASKILQREMQF